MAETSTTAPDGAGSYSTTTSSVGIVQAPQPAQVADATRSVSSDEEWRNPREIKDALKSVRELRAELQSELKRLKSVEHAPAANGNDVLEQLQALKREVEIRDVLGEFNVTGKQRELLMLAAQAAKPANLREFLSGYVQKQEASMPMPQPVQATYPQPSAPSNTGAPRPDVLGTIPDNPMALRPEVIRQMTPAQIREHYENWKTRNSMNHNPLAMKRRGTPVQ